MTSVWQANANRKNAQLSTGPRTEEGKAASSVNAITHGFYSETIDQLLDDPRFETQRLAWVKAFSNGDETSVELANQAFLVNRRVTRLMLLEEAYAARSVSEAPEKFMRQRREAIETADASLLETPFISSTVLGRTQLGTLRLLSRMEHVQKALVEKRWTDDDRRLLRAVVGAGEETHNTQLKDASDVVARLQHVQPLSTEFVEARNLIADRIESTRTNLLALYEDLAGEEQLALKLAIRTSTTDMGKEGRALLRAISQASTQFDRLMNRLEKMAKAGKEPQPAPSLPTVPPPPAPAPVPAPQTIPTAVTESLIRASRNEAVWNFAGSTGRDDREGFGNPIGGFSREEARRKRPPSPMEKKKER